jgi:mannose-6-phosphate isomerase-like protein (cupin superfamily)
MSPPNAERIRLSEKFERIHEPWKPKIVGEVNDAYVKLVKFEGEFLWHTHENEDELFLVLRGGFRLCLRDREIRLGAGELAVVPRGVEHRPVAEEGAEVLLLEPKTTLNTGTVRNARTVERPEWI